MRGSSLTLTGYCMIDNTLPALAFIMCKKCSSNTLVYVNMFRAKKIKTK